MKKFLLFFLLCAFSLSASAQMKWYRYIEVGAGVAVSGLGIDGESRSKAMLTMSLSFYNFYFEYADDMVKGTGTALNWSSSETYKLDKTSVSSLAIGWNIRLKGDKFILTPKIGYTQSYDIYNDPVAFDSYFYSSKSTQVLVGVNAKYFFTDYFGVSLGCAYTQPLNLQVYLRF